MDRSHSHTENLVPVTGGVGFSRDAMNRSNANRDALLSKRKDHKSHGIISGKFLPEDSDLSPEELEVFKADLKIAIKRERRIKLTIFAILFAVVLVGLVVLVW